MQSTDFSVWQQKVEDRLRCIESYLGVGATVPEYVQVVLDFTTRKDGSVKLYTYEDPGLNLVVGDRVLCPASSAYNNDLSGTVVAVDATPPYGITIKPVVSRA